MDQVDQDLDQEDQEDQDLDLLAQEDRDSDLVQDHLSDRMAWDDNIQSEDNRGMPLRD